MKCRFVLGSLFLALGCVTVFAQTDDLPRHGAIGLAVGAAKISEPEDAKTNPVTVKSVVPGGAGEAAGLRVGDILREVDGAPVPTSAEFVRIIGSHLAGDPLSIRLIRDGSEVTTTVILRPRPFETSADAEVLYSSVSANGAKRRVIITRPKSAGRYPAVLLIAGLGCYSVDGELMRKDGYGPILSALTKRNFVTMRVEKPGEGDSEGPPCTDIKATADLEVAGYVAGLRALKGYDFVDPGKVYIFAHSLGPLLGALVLPQESVQGMIAAETVGRSWFEYGLENVRRQAALLGEPFDQIDADTRAHEVCAHHFYVDRETSGAVAKLGPECAAMIRSYAGVPSTYMQQIGDINLGIQWKQVDVPVLVIYGTSDPVTSADEGRYLTGIINSFHPGRATYVEIAGMGHDFNRYASQAEYMTRARSSSPHPYDDEFVAVVVNWLEKQSGS